MYLGIEIGGTKLQLGVGHGDGQPLAELVRADVDRTRGAEGIRQQIQQAGAALLSRHAITAVGIGFGGPVDTAKGQTVLSCHIAGWDHFPIVDWAQGHLGLPVALLNDTDAAGLAEARMGAGRGKEVVFYTNVGSGIGGALIIGGQSYCKGARISAEMGHLRPGLQADQPENTVESLASGWAIGDAARAAILDGVGIEAAAKADLLRRCNGDPHQMTAKIVAQAATDGNPCARAIFGRACQTLGWAIAQVVTLLAPDVVVVGGGVSQCGDSLLFEPLRKEVDRYVFPPQRGRCNIVRAALGEEMVVHGALALASELDASNGRRDDCLSSHTTFSHPGGKTDRP